MDPTSMPMTTLLERASLYSAGLSLFLTSLPLAAQMSGASFRTPADHALLARVIRAEDSRAPADSDLAILRAATTDKNPALRRFGVRALGRLERAELVSMITPVLAEGDPNVRREAANPAGQPPPRPGAP